MTSWDRRAAALLVEAIDLQCRRADMSIEQKRLLAPIRKDVVAASQTELTDARALQDLRLRVCDLCRAFKMCECEAGQGLTRNCAFLALSTP